MRFLFVDRIVHSSPDVIRGIKHITRDDYYLCDDERGKPCFMPSLIGETLGQLAAWNVMARLEFKSRPVAGVVASARLHRPAYVGETLLLESFIDVVDDTAVQYHSVARVNNETVFSIDGALGPLLPMEHFIDPCLVRRQFDEINRPTDHRGDAAGTPSVSLNTASLHSASPMLFDRIMASEPGVCLTAEKNITRAAPYFADHFPNKPVLPLTVLLEGKLNLAREFLARAGFNKAYRVQELRKIKMSDFVYPGDVVFCTVTVKRHNDEELILTFKSEVDRKRVCVLDIVMVSQSE